MKIKNKKQN